jgi:hypothetical protein
MRAECASVLESRKSTGTSQGKTHAWTRGVKFEAAEAKIDCHRSLPVSAHLQPITPSCARQAYTEKCRGGLEIYQSCLFL